MREPGIDLGVRVVDHEPIDRETARGVECEQVRAGQTTDETAFDATDLPGYAGRLFDLRHPENARLQTWAEIERTHIPEDDGAVRRILATKIGEIERGQRAGLVTTDFPPVTLVVVLTDLARTAAVHATRADESHNIAERRAAVVLAARRLTVPH
ncbi:hypothetical protein [Nocardia lijiangensis]|uniref:hypothetical protein n=1 Tax=Nocardia lijiangensis TaxID=299618 RepID=UPI000AF3AA17|nr:hypothetical protein [Nocardia lijiangensis]